MSLASPIVVSGPTDRYFSSKLLSYNVPFRYQMSQMVAAALLSQGCLSRSHIYPLGDPSLEIAMHPFDRTLFNDRYHHTLVGRYFPSAGLARTLRYMEMR